MLIAENAWASLTRWVQDKIEYFNTEGILDTASYLEWDAHAALNDLPSADVVGLKAFALMEDENVISISCAIGVGTFNETNLFRLRKGSGYSCFKLCFRTTPSPIWTRRQGKFSITW